MLASLLIVFSLAAAPDVRDEAQKRAQQGRYEEAIKLCREEYERTRDVSFLYCEAQAERWRGNCERALEIYVRILPEVPEGDMKNDTRDNIETCADQLENEEQKPEPDPEPPSPVVTSPEPTPPPTSAPPQPVDRPTPWWRDPTGGVLIGVGVVGVATGGGLLVGGAARRRGADAAQDEAAFVDGHGFANRLTVAGAVLTGVGAALVVGGIIRYGIVARRLRRAPGLAIRF